MNPNLSTVPATLRWLAASLSFASVVAVAPPAPAQEPIPCGRVYRVEPGDTLHSIAVRAYGEGNYLAIFEANRDVLPSVTRIEVGDQLLIPCVDGSGPQTRREYLGGGASGAEGTGGTPETPGGDRVAALAAIPPEREIRLLTGPDFAPFVDPALPEGGLVTELVRLALDRAAFGRSFSIAVGEDWSAHLEALERGTFDLGFPWYRPDCNRAARLGPSMQRRCADFVFSEPLYEVGLAWYARAGDPLLGVSEAAGLSDHRLCRPATYFTFDLLQAGLTASTATLVFPSTAEECLVLLEAGVVDAVSLARSAAEPEIARLGLEGRVAEIEALASVQTLHAIAHDSNVEARAFLSTLDFGLAEIRESGRWFEVVSRHLGPLGLSLR